MTWLRDILTGPNNETLAIGRVLGILLFFGVLLFFPTLITAVLILQHVKPEVWFAYMDKLVPFVPAMILAIWGLIRGTNSTEPKA